jgi:hypothetical protein
VSSLTEQERLGLEEVFLSISSSDDRIGTIASIQKRIRDISQRRPFGRNVRKPFSRAYTALGRIRVPKLRHFLKIRKKK